MRTALPLSELRVELPAIFDALMHAQILLERHFRDVQVSLFDFSTISHKSAYARTLSNYCKEIEFTVENGVLFILETRTAQKSAQASVTAAVCMVKERIITEREALLRLDANQMDYFLHPVIDSSSGTMFSIIFWMVWLESFDKLNTLFALS